MNPIRNEMRFSQAIAHLGSFIRHWGVYVRHSTRNRLRNSSRFVRMVKVSKDPLLRVLPLVFVFMGIASFFVSIQIQLMNSNASRASYLVNPERLVDTEGEEG